MKQKVMAEQPKKPDNPERAFSRFFKPVLRIFEKRTAGSGKKLRRVEAANFCWTVESNER